MLEFLPDILLDVGVKLKVCSLPPGTGSQLDAQIWTANSFVCPQDRVCEQNQKHLLFSGCCNRRESDCRVREGASDSIDWGQSASPDLPVRYRSYFHDDTKRHDSDLPGRGGSSDVPSTF